MSHPNLPSSIVQPILPTQQQTAIKAWNRTYFHPLSRLEIAHNPSLAMPAEDLRKSLAKAKVEAEIERQHLEDKKRRYDEYDRAKSFENWKNWDAALEAYANGWRPPEPRFYIVISPQSPVSTPEKLQEIAKMTSAPKLVDTTYTGLRGEDPDAAQMQQDGKPQKVRVGEVSWEELQEVRSKTDYNMHLCVWIKEKVRGVVLVKSLAPERVHG